MATAEEVPPAQTPDMSSPVDISRDDASEDARLKRRASNDRDLDSGSPKRAKYEDNTSADSRRRPASPRRRLDEVPSNVGQERLKSATQEEKKRGKRLFGGMLSTLSQTSTNTQQKRRLEIEKKQQERIQKQRIEDDQKRAEKLAILHDIRMAEQMVFEEKVIQAKHSKKLVMAQYLRTKAEPQIYYLPWKRTPEQEELIDDQVREAKDSIERELVAFEVRKQEHTKRHGPSRRLNPENESSGVIVKADPSAMSPETVAQDSAPVGVAEKDHTEKDHNDESGDVLVEAGEDMVIY